MKPRKIAILQPNYIPWKGVFDLINQVDVFVFYDDVQYTKKDWRSRNKIKSPNGEHWITVPVITKGKREQLISEAEIDNTQNWQSKHYKSILGSYSKAPYFDQYSYIIDEIYINNKWKKLVDLNIFSTKLIADILGIKVEWYKSSDYNFTGDKSGEKVVKLCKQFDCNYFINGPASKAFMNQELFNKNNIELKYMEYEYPQYKQLYPPFDHYVTVLDTIFHCGEEAKKFIFTREK